MTRVLGYGTVTILIGNTGQGIVFVNVDPYISNLRKF